MPVSWRILNGLVLLESDEDATFEEWRAAVESALASPDCRPGMGLLHDIRRVARVPLVGEVEARVYFLAGQMRAHAIKRWAIVVTGDEAYGMGRVGEALANAADDIEFRTFKERAEAEAWLSGGAVE